jgi:hypothetical protein
MKKLMFKAVLAASLVLVAGCGKKEEKAASSDKTTEAQPADKAPVAPAPSPVAPVAPAEPPKLMDVAEVPSDIPQECKDARAAYVKIHDCAKLDEKTRATMVKSWNDMVDGTFKQWKTGSEKDKATVLDICKKLPETANMLTKDC